MKDFLGQDIKVGDRVVWGAGGRRTHGIRVGEVTQVVPAEESQVGYRQKLDYVVVKATQEGSRGGTMWPRQVVVVGSKGSREEKLEGSIRFLLCFFEPDKHPHLDTEALKNAVAGAKHLVGQS